MRCRTAFFLLLTVLVPTCVVAGQARTAPQPLTRALGPLQGWFEENQGQWEPSARFVSRGREGRLVLTQRAALFVMDHSSDGTPSEPIRLEFVGADSAARVAGHEPLPGRVSYFLGSDQRQWRPDVPAYSRVEYESLYPGVDLAFYRSRGELEFDWRLAAGVDPRQLTLKVRGAVARESGDGHVDLEAPKAGLRLRKPVAYQEVGGVRRFVDVAYDIRGKSRIGFRLGSYDRGLPLVIDPAVEFSTYLGGSSGDAAMGLARDVAGNLYVAGSTSSSNFPTKTPYQASPKGTDVFVVKLSSDGSSLVYATFLGGGGTDSAFGVAVDAAGSAYVTGGTLSSDFPTTAGAFQRKYGGVWSWGLGDAFVTKLDPAGSGLVYSSYLGGSHDEKALAVAVDGTGSAYLTGETNSTGLGTSGAFQKDFAGGTYDAFVAKVSPAGDALTYLTYLGKGDNYDCGAGIAVDAAGNAFVVGSTQYQFPTTPGAFQTTSRGGIGEVFVTKLNPTGSQLVYSTLLGGNSNEDGYGIAIDSDGNAVVTGYTGSTDFPLKNAFQTSYKRFLDAFVTKLNADGSALVFSTYLGGSDPNGSDVGQNVAVDPQGFSYVVGYTGTKDFPVVNPVQPANGGGTCGSYYPKPCDDAFLSKFSPAGDLVFSTYLGGKVGEVAYAVAVDESGNAFLAGSTSSSDFPTVRAFQSRSGGGQDAFVAKISTPPSVVVSSTLFVPVVLVSGGASGSFYTSEMTITNRGTTAAELSYLYTAAFGGGGGTGADRIEAGHQVVITDAVTYLRSRGVPIPDSGNRGGTLRVTFDGLSSASAAAITVRTTTPVPPAAPIGRAGLAYGGFSPATALAASTYYLCGLRQNQQDRTNVSVQNAGGPGEGSIRVRLRYFPSASSTSSGSVEVPLEPGGFQQLALTDLSPTAAHGFVEVTRLSGTAPYYAYAVINDQANSDGSFVTPFRGATPRGMTLPVVVETPVFSTELMLTNLDASNDQSIDLTYVADALAGGSATTRLTVRRGEQLLIPSFVQYLRDQGVAGVGTVGATFAGALTVRPASQPNLLNLSVAARTSSPGGGGWYGLFYPAVPFGEAATSQAWLFGLRQDEENRTNLALVNTGETDSSADTFRIEVFDGDRGALAGTIERTVAAGQYLQIGKVLEVAAPGARNAYARVTRTGGNNPFVTYAVINDGANPNERSGDGAFVVADLNP